MYVRLLLFLLLCAFNIALFDSQLRIDSQWFFETAGESDSQSERSQQIASIQNLFLINGEG